MDSAVRKIVQEPKLTHKSSDVISTLWDSNTISSPVDRRTMKAVFSVLKGGRSDG